MVEDVDKKGHRDAKEDQYETCIGGTEIGWQDGHGNNMIKINRKNKT